MHSTDSHLDPPLVDAGAILAQLDDPAEVRLVLTHTSHLGDLADEGHLLAELMRSGWTVTRGGDTW